MTTPGGRRSGRRVLSWLLALALLGVVGFVVIRDIGGGEPEPTTMTIVTGVIGSEKLAFFADQRVRDVFRANGLEVRVDPAGSRQIATTVRLDDYDFAFPSCSPAADKLLAERPAARTYAPFSSPMVVATFAPIVDLLTQEGVVAPGTTTFDVHRYLALAATGTRWNQLPGDTAFPARKNVLLSTTAPCQSNSAAMYLGIASYAANADAVMADPAAAAAVVSAVRPRRSPGRPGPRHSRPARGRPDTRATPPPRPTVKRAEPSPRHGHVSLFCASANPRQVTMSLGGGSAGRRVSCRRTGRARWTGASRVPSGRRARPLSRLPGRSRP